MYLVSSCLAGHQCKYNGEDNKQPIIIELVNKGEAIPVCPEQLGGLTTPRIPCEIIEEQGQVRIINQQGEDKTEAFKLGAKRCVAIAKALNIKKAILKSRSPSCGYGRIYDGTFSGTLKDGNGVTAQTLLESGIDVITEEELV